jgi:colanic acid/amylovoran biosynthesis glycosyltransferase
MESKPLKIAHYLYQYLQLTENWIAPMVRGPEGTSSCVFSVRLPTNLEFFPFEPVYTIEGLPEDEMLDEARFLKRYGYVRCFASAAKKEGVRVIHAHFGDVGTRALSLKAHLQVPLVTSFYGYDLAQLPKHPVWAQAYKVLFEIGDAFVVEGSNARRCLIELGCPQEKIRIIHFGIDQSAIPFHERTLAPGTPINILMASRLVPKKGTVYGLRSLALLRARRPDLQFELTLVGDGPERDTVMAEIGKLALGNVTRAYPFWTHDEFLSRLPDYHILLQPSTTAPDGDHEGGAPVSLLEAQSSGALIVASRHADIPEYVCEGRSGLLTTEKDIQACAKALENLVAQADRWPAMGRAGREHVSRNYRVVAQLGQLKELYTSVSNRNSMKADFRQIRSSAARWADLLWLGRFFHNWGHAIEARSVFREIVRLDPGNSIARFKLAVAALRLGRIGRDRQLSSVIQEQVASMDLSDALALAREAAGWPAQRWVAGKIVAAMLRKSPEYVPGLYLKADLAKTSSRQSEARELYRQILKLSSDPLFVGGAHFHLGECLLQEGNRDDARKHFRSCLWEIPNHKKAVERLIALS